jgi:hypothetical protein
MRSPSLFDLNEIVTSVRKTRGRARHSFISFLQTQVGFLLIESLIQKSIVLQ